MKKAFLNYSINTKEGTKKVFIESDFLDYIDEKTYLYKNDDELINHCLQKNKILQFISENNMCKGKFEIEYPLEIDRKITIPVLFNTFDELVLVDDFMNGKISEIEKARKLLFTSKNQLFAKLFLMNSDIHSAFSYKFQISDEERFLAEKNNLRVTKDLDAYYVDFIDLIKYRIENYKLGNLRNLYEDILETWKNELELMTDDFYYCSRQLAWLINEYNNIKNKNLSICRLFITKKCYTIIHSNCIFKNNSRHKSFKKVFNESTKKSSEAA